MLKFGFLFFLGFSCLFLCKGLVFSPSKGTSRTFTNGSTEKLVWLFEDDRKSFGYRLWSFTPSDGQPLVPLARFNDDDKDEILATSYDVAVQKPATLVLKNVNLTYNGTYRFSLPPYTPSDVFVYIAVRPTATASHKIITVNEGGDVSCLCQGQGGNPPADVTWYKDNRKIGGTGKEQNTLTLKNVTNEKHNGSYKCVAQSHPDKMFQHEDKLEVIVYYKPKKTKINVREEAYVGEKLVINCSSEGFPVPSFTITHNVTTNIVSNQSWYIKDKVDHRDAGLYECIAKNFLGNVTDSGNLIVKEKRPSTKSTRQKPTTQSTRGKTTVRTKDNGGGGSSAGFSTGAIAGTCVAVVVVMLWVIVIIVVRKCRLYTRNEKNGRNRSKRGAPEKNAAPPVYAAVDKENRQGNPLYATLDNDAMKQKIESKKHPVDRAPQTVYARIDFKKTAKAATKAAKAAKAEPV